MNEGEKERTEHRRAMFPAIPLREALDQLDCDPDDSANRTEFLKSLAVYMLDKGIELSGLQVALAYEERDRRVLAETQRLIDQLANKPTVQTYHELLQRAYMLLGDISHPFRNVERYDVQKWLEDAMPLIDKTQR